MSHSKTSKLAHSARIFEFKC